MSRLREQGKQGLAKIYADFPVEKEAPESRWQWQKKHQQQQQQASLKNRNFMLFRQHSALGQGFGLGLSKFSS